MDKVYCKDCVHRFNPLVFIVHDPYCYKTKVVVDSPVREMYKFTACELVNPHNDCKDFELTRWQKFKHSLLSKIKNTAEH